MPYIKSGRRKEIDPLIDVLQEVLQEKGDYNYAMTRLLHSFLASKPRVCYNSLSETHGLAQDVAAEFYRVVVAPYEDIKREENGTVGELDK